MTRPANSPTSAELVRPDCHAAVINLESLRGSYVPNRSLNCDWPKKELIWRIYEYGEIKLTGYLYDDYIVAFHDQSRGQCTTPEDSLPVLLQGGKEGQLAIGCIAFLRFPDQVEGVRVAMVETAQFLVGDNYGGHVCCRYRRWRST